MAVNQKKSSSLRFQPLSPPANNASQSANNSSAASTPNHSQPANSFSASSASLHPNNTLKTANLNQSTTQSPPGKPPAKSSELSAGISTNELFFLHSAAAEGLTPHELKTVLKGRIGGDIIQSLGYKNAQEGQQRLSEFIDSHYGNLLDRAAQRYGRQDLINTARLGSNRFGRLNIDNSAESISAAQEAQIGDALLGNFQQALESGAPHTYIERLYQRESSNPAPPPPPPPVIAAQPEEISPAPVEITTASVSTQQNNQSQNQNWSYYDSGSDLSTADSETANNLSAVEEANITAASSTLGDETPNLIAKEQNEEELIQTASSTLGDETPALIAQEQSEDKLIETVSSTLGDGGNDSDSGSFSSQDEIDDYYDRLESTISDTTSSALGGEYPGDDTKESTPATPADQDLTAETPAATAQSPAATDQSAAVDELATATPSSTAGVITNIEIPAEADFVATPEVNSSLMNTEASTDNLTPSTSSTEFPTATPDITLNTTPATPPQETTTTTPAANRQSSEASPSAPAAPKAAGSALTITTSAPNKKSSEQTKADDSAPSLKVEKGTLKSERGQLKTANIDQSERADHWKTRLQKEISWQEKQQQSSDEQSQAVILPKIKKSPSKKGANRLLAGLAAISSQSDALAPATATLSTATAPPAAAPPATSTTPASSQGSGITAKLKSVRFATPAVVASSPSTSQELTNAPAAPSLNVPAARAKTSQITRRFSQLYSRYQQSTPWKSLGAVTSLFAAKAAYGAEVPTGASSSPMSFTSGPDVSQFSSPAAPINSPPASFAQSMGQQAAAMGKQAVTEKISDGAKSLGKKVVGDRLQTAKQTIAQSQLAHKLGRASSSIANSKLGKAGKSLNKGLGKLGAGANKLGRLANKTKLLDPNNLSDHIKNQLALNALKALYKMISLLAKLALKLAGLLVKLAILAIKLVIAALPVILTIFAVYLALKGVIAIFGAIWEFFFGEDDSANHMARINGEESVVNPDDCIVVRKTPHTYIIKNPTPDTQVAYNFSVRPNGSDKTEIEIISCKDQVEIKCNEKDSADCTNETRDDFQETVCRHVPTGPLNGEIAFTENYQLPRVGSYTLINTFTVQAKCKIKDKDGNTKEKEQTAEAKASVCVGEKCSEGMCWPLTPSTVTERPHHDGAWNKIDVRAGGGKTYGAAGTVEVRAAISGTFTFRLQEYACEKGRYRFPTLNNMCGAGCYVTWHYNGHTYKVMHMVKQCCLDNPSSRHFEKGEYICHTDTTGANTGTHAHVETDSGKIEEHFFPGMKFERGSPISNSIQYKPGCDW